MKFIVIPEIILPWQYLFIFKIVLTRSWVQFSTIPAAYKTAVSVSGAIFHIFTMAIISAE